MNKENASKLWKIIQEAGDYLSDQRFTFTDLYRPLQTLVHSSYAGHLKFIKNKSHKDSLKTPLKLETRLETFEINQIVNIDTF